MQVISWKNGGFESGKVLVNVLSQNSNTKEIQILMASGAAMNEHKAPFDISVQVLCGEIEFVVGSDKAVLKELDMVSLKANEAHSLRALKDSIVRLSLAQGDSISRVESVLKG